MSHISVVIPVYQAETFLRELYLRLKSSLEIITSDFEILLVDDCSSDHSWQIIQELSRQDSRIKGFKFSRNFGQHYGITAGLDHSEGDWVVVMDCDLQDRPEEIVRLYRKAQEGFDVVLAKREVRQDPFFKKMASWLFYKIFNYFLDIEYNGQVGNFRILSRKVVLSFRHMRENLRFFGGIISWMGYRTATLSVQHVERKGQKSSYTFKKSWKLAIDSIMAYSDKPLRLVIRLGFIMSLSAFCYGIYTLIHALLNGSTVPGWTSLIVSIYFIGGIVIAILGIIGIYLGKTFEETKKRPLYIIEQVTS